MTPAQLELEACAARRARRRRGVALFGMFVPVIPDMRDMTNAVALAAAACGAAYFMWSRHRESTVATTFAAPAGAAQLLIDADMPAWKTDSSIADELQALLPDVPILAWDACKKKESVDLSHVRMVVIVGRVRTELISRLPRLAVVQKLGAGVEHVVGDPQLPPAVRVTRLKPSAAADEIAEYALAYALHRQRNMATHEAQQREKVWQPIGPLETPRTTVGVLGLGHIGGRIARTFASLGFVVLGWARSAHALPAVECLVGESGLESVLRRSDIVVAILPSTPQTVRLLDARRLALMKAGSQLINVGRGDAIDEAALLAALDAGRPATAVLDVVSEEPLPSSSPLWSHPGVTLTPHVSGWRITGGMETVADNWGRLVRGAALLHEVDRTRGY